MHDLFDIPTLRAAEHQRRATDGSAQARLERRRARSITAPRGDLRVGRPVRAVMGWGSPDGRSLASYPGRRKRHPFNGPVPLDFGQRCERYIKQGPRRVLTDRQHRRAQKKANHAAAPFGHKEGEWSA